jgi:signal transduction histidine kinase
MLSCAQFHSLLAAWETLPTMSFLSRFQLRTWLFAGFFSIAALPVMLLIAWVYQNAVDNEYRAVREKHLIVAQNLSFALSRYANDAKAVFQIISDDVEGAKNSTNLKATAGKFHFEFFSVLTPDGQPKAFIDFGEPSKNQPPPPDLLNELNGMVDKSQNEIVFGGIKLLDGKPYFPVIQKTADGDLNFALLAPHYLVKLQKTIAFGERGHSMIVDQFGHVVAHPNAKWQATAKDASKLSVVKKMMAQKTGVAEFYSPPMKADMIAGHTFVPETGWGVMVPQPVEELIDSARSFQSIAIAVAIGGMIIAVCLGWWMSNLVAARLSSLAGAARLISEGDLEARAEKSNSAAPLEIEELAVTFNEMADNLQKMTAHLTEALKKAEAANIAKSQFLSMMSHELRTPMNGIIGAIDLVKEISKDDEIREYSEMALTSSSNLINIIDDVLDFSTLESGQLKLRDEEFDLGVLTEEVKTLMSIEARNKGLDVSINIGADVPARVTADRNRIRQVLVNLIGNAIKFTDQGQVNIELSHLNENDESDVIRVLVRDTGVGIEKEKQPEIFDYFFQADSSLSRSKGGTGLGLSISRNLVELMGGEIGFQSELNQGSEFWFTFPSKA